MTTQTLSPLRYRVWFSNGARSTLFSPVASLSYVRRTGERMAEAMSGTRVIAIVKVRK